MRRPKIIKSRVRISCLGDQLYLGSADSVEEQGELYAAGVRLLRSIRGKEDYPPGFDYSGTPDEELPLDDWFWRWPSLEDAVNTALRGDKTAPARAVEQGTLLQNAICEIAHAAERIIEAVRMARAIVEPAEYDSILPLRIRQVIRASEIIKSLAEQGLSLEDPALNASTLQMLKAKLAELQEGVFFLNSNLEMHLANLKGSAIAKGLAVEADFPKPPAPAKV